MSVELTASESQDDDSMTRCLSNSQDDDSMVSFSIEKHGISRVVWACAVLKDGTCVSRRLIVIAS